MALGVGLLLTGCEERGGTAAVPLGSTSVGGTTVSASAAVPVGTAGAAAGTAADVASARSGGSDSALRDARGRWSWQSYEVSPADLALAQRVDDARQQFDDGLYDQAQTSVGKLLGEGCTHPELFLIQARLHAQRGETAQATGWCDRAIAASPWWVEPRILLAQCYVKLERLGAAESVFADIDRLAPHSPWGPYGQGAVASQRTDYERAIRFADQALERDPDHLPSLELRIRLAVVKRDPVLEEQLLGRFLRQRPDSAWAWERLGDLALEGNRLEDARRALERSYALAPGRDLAQRLVDIALRRGDQAEAARWQVRAGTRPTDAPGK
jgi:tetratricopeptide (TPR) repeat protein